MDLKKWLDGFAWNHTEAFGACMFGLSILAVYAAGYGAMVFFDWMGW